MEKRRPSYDIDAVKRAIRSADTLRMTTSAALGMAELGLDEGDVVGIVQSITRPMFLKSMTAYADHRVWQDVYHVPFQGLVLYIKFQAHAVTSFSLVSFKER